jgi:DNA transformation protein and related proteins
MIMGNSLYFVVDKDTRGKYEQAGMQPFSYTTKKGHIHVRRYFELPEDILTDPEQLRVWASEAMFIAGSTKPKKVLRILLSPTCEHENNLPINFTYYQ